MNLRDLKYLVALADLRHFGKAADACFVGDRLVDLQAAHAARVDGFMLRSGYWHDWPRAMQSDTPPVATFDDVEREDVGAHRAEGHGQGTQAAGTVGEADTQEVGHASDCGTRPSVALTRPGAARRL